ALEPALEQCRQLHRRLRDDPMAQSSETGFLVRKPLSYSDGKTFLELVDRRDVPRILELRGISREIYLYCMEIRREDSIARRFAGRCSQTMLRKALTTFVAEKLMFEEDGKYLSLAVAPTPRVAARRI